MALWKKTLFWGKVKDSLAIGAILSQAGLEMGNASETVKLIVAGGSIAAYLVGMWMEDKNQDGIVDIFEDNEIKPK